MDANNEPTAKVRITRGADGSLTFTWLGPEDGLVGVSEEILENIPGIDYWRLMARAMADV